MFFTKIFIQREVVTFSSFSYMYRLCNVPLTRDAFATFDSTLVGKNDTKNSRIDGTRLWSLFRQINESKEAETIVRSYLNTEQDKDETIQTKSNLCDEERKILRTIKLHYSYTRRYSNKTCARSLFIGDIEAYVEKNKPYLGDCRDGYEKQLVAIYRKIIWKR